MQTLSTSAVLLDAETYQIASGLEVAIHTDSDGDSIVRIGRTAHALSDVLDGYTMGAITDDTERLFLAASNQHVLL